MPTLIPEIYVGGGIVAAILWIVLMVSSSIDWSVSGYRDRQKYAQRLLWSMTAFVLIPVWPVAFIVGAYFGTRQSWRWVNQLRGYARGELQ